MSELGYIPKELCFDDEARTKLINGITTLSKAVKSTLGPRGQTVLIESTDHLQGMTVTKDGVTVARSIDLNDAVENLAVRMMKQASEKTASVAGDGTTTAIVLTEALVKAGMEHISPDHNKTEVIRFIQDLSEKVIARLEKKSKKITKSRLLDVATISANNDKELGKIIASAYNEVGPDGVVTVERSQTDKTYAEVTAGIRMDRGYSSNLFINNHKKDECILEDVRVLVCDHEINNVLQIQTVLEPIIKGGLKLLLIAPCSGNVVNTLAANVARNGLQLCAVTPPSFGFRQHELMQDIALAVGAKYFSEKTGDDLSLIHLGDLGHADKVIVGKESAVLIKSNQVTDEISTRIEQLKEQQSTTKNKGERDFINSRIASLAGGIGCIYVGGVSDIEQKEKHDRVDDAVCAVRSALQEGILPGGGLALYREGVWLFSNETDEDGEFGGKNGEAAIDILEAALRAPAEQILENAGKPWSLLVKISDSPENDSWGYDVKNECSGDMYKMGIIDPLKVTKHALRNAVSVATTILSTNAIVTHARA